jgi:hypothetical protein
MLDNPEKINELARKLVRFQCVTKHDHDGEIEGGTLANGFADLEKSFRKFIGELLPKLASEALTEREVHDVLLSIGEEFRHINYHLRDNRFYQYLWENSDCDAPLPQGAPIKRC